MLSSVPGLSLGLAGDIVQFELIAVSFVDLTVVLPMTARGRYHVYALV